LDRWCKDVGALGIQGCVEGRLDVGYAVVVRVHGQLPKKFGFDTRIDTHILYYAIASSANAWFRSSFCSGEVRLCESRCQPHGAGVRQ
jgi:hypothetical protein